MDFYKLNINEITSDQRDFLRGTFPKRYWKAVNYRFDRDKDRCLGAYLLLEKAFPGFKEEDINFTELGKPYFKIGLRFNYSHSGDYVVLVTDNDEVGVDIEQIREKNFSVLKNCFSNREFAWIEEKNSLERFLTLWCKKESLLKLFGLGISVKLNEIDVLDLDSKKPSVFFEKEVYNKTFTLDNHIVSVSSFNKPDFI